MLDLVTALVTVSVPNLVTGSVPNLVTISVTSRVTNLGGGFRACTLHAATKGEERTPPRVGPHDQRRSSEVGQGFGFQVSRARNLFSLSLSLFRSLSLSLSVCPPPPFTHEPNYTVLPISLRTFDSSATRGGANRRVGSRGQ